MKHLPSRQLAPCLLAVAALLASACTPFQPGLPSEPVAPGAGTGVGVALAEAARSQIGVRYRWGGADPNRGFDCSGLVAWVHAREGLVVPRTASQQHAAARRIDEGDLRPGDLVFFRLEGRARQVSHVGIYAGQRRFVHAPQTGRPVGEASLDDPWYRARFAGAGRFHEDGAGRGPRLTPRSARSNR